MTVWYRIAFYWVSDETVVAKTIILKCFQSFKQKSNNLRDISLQLYSAYKGYLSNLLLFHSKIIPMQQDANQSFEPAK